MEDYEADVGLLDIIKEVHTMCAGSNRLSFKFSYRIGAIICLTSPA